jgi:uncharacterized metal-binding protein
MEEKLKMSCIDCGAVACDGSGKPFPDFCVTKDLSEEEIRQVIDLYRNDEENLRIMTAAAEVELEHYCQYTRLQEIMEFAKKIGATRLGIATCVGLLQESRLLARILRANGFEVFGAGCKTGCVKKTDLGLDPKHEGTGSHTCNPILQAKVLAKFHTQLNIVMGLCVGHDSLFYKYSEAPVTTLVAKDRVTGHNPIAALHVSHSYYKKKLYPEQPEEEKGCCCKKE